MNTVIKGGRVIDPSADFDAQQDLYIADGKILAKGRAPEGYTAQHVIDASGQIVCPGFVDLRARLREPGHKNKGTIASESQAAAKSGVTTLCCPPDTDPVIDTPAVVEWIHQRAEHVGKAKVVPLGALTQNLAGNQLSEMYALKQAGCIGVSNALNPVSAHVFRRAMEYAASQGLTVYVHPEDHQLSAGGCTHEGTVSVRLGLPGIPETAETIAVSQVLQLVELTGADTHFCQLSTAAAAQMIARAQYDGLPITADVTAHQLFLTEMDIGFFNAQCHVKPPLRTQRDLEGLREYLANGTISAICSDHQPHDVDAKLAPFPSTEPGISALETLLPLTLRLVEEGLLDLSDAIARLTLFPSNILDISAGTLQNGRAADICVFDPEHYWMLSPDSLASFGHNTPFLGWEFKGLVTHTLLDGNLVFKNENMNSSHSVAENEIVAVNATENAAQVSTAPVKNSSTPTTNQYE